MDIDLSGPDDAVAAAVLLHPHPDFGGDRSHPLVGGLYRRLPTVGVAAARFDFTSSDRDAALDQAVAAIDAVTDRWPDRPVALVGYSFGAGIAAAVGDARVAGWYLVAPQAAPLAGSAVGTDPRPKVVVTPEHDQYGPPAAIAAAVAGWTATTFETVPGDHFLAAALARIIESTATWIGTGLTSG